MASAVAHLINFAIEIWVQLPAAELLMFFIFINFFSLALYLYRNLKIGFSLEKYVNFHLILFVNKLNNFGQFLNEMKFNSMV